MIVCVSKFRGGRKKRLPGRLEKQTKAAVEARYAGCLQIDCIDPDLPRRLDAGGGYRTPSEDDLILAEQSIALAAASIRRRNGH